MSAEIIQFPKKIKLKQVKSVDLYHCWDQRLEHPLLNSLYKPEVNFVERWYLHTVHLLNLDELNHPFIQLLLSPNDTILDLLIELIKKDLTIQYNTIGDSFNESVEINIKKLNRYLIKFQGLQQYRMRS